MNGSRLLWVAVVAGIVAAAVWLLWPWLVGAGVLALCWRVITRDLRRRRRPRPRSSWSSLGRTAALLFAAWNSRWLRSPAGVRATVPPRAGRESEPDADELERVPF